MLDDILRTCNPTTRLKYRKCADITMPTESIITRSVAEWLRERPDIDKKPVGVPPSGMETVYIVKQVTQFLSKVFID
ncbi:MAG: hypothetical protein MZV63_04090 [Marinilabiliales bacterium]|nr:hypothetical protein [Marinilabiliales bacterium]